MAQYGDRGGRVPDPVHQYIGYRLNILGIRVWRDFCQLVAKDGHGEWMPIGAPRPLPVYIPDNPSHAESDALVLTALQYDSERPGSDIRDVLSQRKPFDQALRDEGRSNSGAGTVAG